MTLSSFANMILNQNTNTCILYWNMSHTDLSSLNMIDMWISPTVDLIRRNTNSDNRNTKKYVRRLLRANVWNYNMLLSNISNVLHNFTFSPVKVFEATAQRSLGRQGREILSMIFWGTFFANMNAAFKQSRPSFWPKWHFSWRGLEPGPGEGEMPSIEMPCMQLCIKPPASDGPGSCYFEIIAHLGQKNAHTWPKPFILDRSPLMRNWAKARINFALQLMAIREILNASYNLQ